MSASSGALRSRPASKRDAERPSGLDAKLRSGAAGGVIRTASAREKAASSASSELGQAVAPRTRSSGAGRDPAPAPAAGAGPGVRPERDPAGLEQAQGGDQAAEGLDGAGARVGAALGVVARLAGGSRLTRATARKVGSQPAPPEDSEERASAGTSTESARMIEAVARSSAASPCATRATARRPRSRARSRRRWPELGDRRRQAVVVEREVGRVVPEALEEDDRGSSARRRPSGGTPRCRCRRRYAPARSADSIAAQAAPNESSSRSSRGVLTDEAAGQRRVLGKRRAVGGLGDVVGDLLALGDQLAKPLRGIAGHRLQCLSDNQIAHGVRLRPGTDVSCRATSVATGITPARSSASRPVWPVQGAKPDPAGSCSGPAALPLARYGLGTTSR